MTPINFSRAIAVSLLLLAGCIGARGAGAFERDVEIAGPAGAIKGVLREPDHRHEKFLVLIVPGSGPTDRDGNNPLGVAAAPYRMLSEALARSGVATARFDKRGLFASAGAIGDANAVTIDDYADDVRSWATTLSQTTSLPCIWVLGHSEGGLISLVAAQTGTRICGLILVAAPGRPMGELIRAQLERAPANKPLLPDAERAIRALESGHTIDVAEFPAPLRGLFAPQVQGFLINAFSYDPQRLIRNLRMPVLIIQGTNDLQVSAHDAEQLAAACPHATLVSIEHMNHVLKEVPDGDDRGNLASYRDGSLPLAPRLVGAIVDFLSPATHAESGSTATQKDTPADVPISAAAAAGSACAVKAARIADALIQRDYPAATAFFGKKLSDALPVDKLQAAWDTMSSGQGDPAPVGKPQQIPGMDPAITNEVVDVTYASGKLELIVSCSADGEVAGLHLRPGPAK